MKLFFREYGSDGPKLIILHGLYGASDNWVSIARQLQNDYHVYLIDQRNHGQSPHDSEMNYTVMADDLHEFFLDNKIEKAHLAGHSMGGKTVMRFALTYPELIDKLVVLDIAPKSYASYSNYAQITNNHSLIIKSLLKLEYKEAKSRTDIDKQLAQYLPSKTLRQFLLKNIDRTKAGDYQWRLNLPVLKENLENIMDGFSDLDPEAHHVALPSIFITGEKSGYVMDEDTLIIRKYFKDAEIVTIPNADHWLHAEQPELLVKTLAYFLLD
ncbi:alpha/beta fold hydrolase [Carboxylicivirga linearis]|uniref:Alpha/beta fold hydrolase n=1 Tax=Carboxylicivirga linearis TaxID=1628157 RepID=A0ABS5JQH7_9BACT|nr:alpha/beta fold hydrolase [Carboxylicivirga linearis]MBS2097131.1 alpha/beta fold hydrolase [Carboxylicivirga linearis]